MEVHWGVLGGDYFISVLKKVRAHTMWTHKESRGSSTVELASSLKPARNWFLLILCGVNKLSQISSAHASQGVLVVLCWV